MAGTSGLQGRNLCEVPISLSLLPDCLHPCYWGARLMVGGTRLSDGRCLEPSGMHLYLFLASHEPNSLWPRCASNVCSGALRAPVSPSLHSLFERKLLVSHFKIPMRPLVRDD